MMNKNSILTFSLIILCFFSCAFSSKAADPGTPDAVFAFARYLEETGDYYRAITEYRRFIFFWPEHSLANECRYRIGRSYMQGSEYSRAAEVFQELFVMDRNPTGKLQSGESYAESLFYLHRYSLAASLLAELETHADSNDALRLRLNRTWCYLKLRDPVQASELWEIPAHQPIRDAIRALEVLPEKNPVLAGYMSALIPGAGQVYAGRWRDGVIAFLVNSLFIGGIVMAIDRDHDETAAVLGFFEAGFYTANIYNAVNDAHKANRETWETGLDHMERLIGPPFHTGFSF
ncbi:hypothetical protein JXA80_14065 [bacterium]|nr:hypothetical protein [candidate division CSSED10-310 bacterium]